MTVLTNGFCTTEIAIDESFPSDANFESRYDIIINLDDRPRNDFSKAYFIGVKLRDREYSAAMIGDRNCWDTRCAIIEDEQLTVLQGWRVTQFDIRTASVIRSIELDTTAPNFEIYKVGTGYLIYGETAVTMLDKELKLLWSFSGRDIFVSATGKTSFEIKADRICLYDFEDNYYELDYQGHIIHIERS